MSALSKEKMEKIKHSYDSMNMHDNGLSSGDSGSVVFRCGEFLFKTGKDQSALRLRQQVEWWKKLPDKYRNHFPYVYGFGESQDQAWVCMENLKMTTLSEALYQTTITASKGIDVLGSIHDWILTHLWEDKTPTNSSSLLLLLDQVDQRHAQILDSNHATLKQLIRANRVKVNNRWLIGGNRSIQILRQKKKILQKLSPMWMVLAHGDLHTGNILFDESEFRLIDQRGNFQGNHRHFDIAYDSGKMLHDLHAKYTLIRKGDFELERNKQDSFDFFVLDSHCKATYQTLFAWYREWCDMNQSSLQEPLWWVRSFLYEALLLCGIVPFHLSHRNRATALYLCGLILLNRWINYVNGSVPLSLLFDDLDQ